ncbi:MAG: ABC transporter permease [Deltaproteobacteria bacterium]|nr:ABC transporter permease [Deltaproteobacteria bacterium]
MYKRYQPTFDSLKFSTYLLWKRKSPVFGFAIIIALILSAIFAPYLAPYQTDDYIGKRISGPSRDHLLGVDHLGRDLFSRVIYGSRVSIKVGVLAVGLSLSIGTFLGLISGFYGKFLDNIIMRAMDIMMSLPYILLAILIATVLGPSLENAILAIGIVRIPRFARLARGSSLSVKELQFIEASHSVGASNFRIIRKDVLPNIIGPVIVYATLSLGDAILGSAVLSFLGLGAQPPIPEWGAMLNEAQKFITIAPYLSIFPGIAIFLTVLGFNLFGDGLRDILDPKSKR